VPDAGDPRQRLAALGRLPDAALPLAEAALWIAAEEYPGLDVTAWLGRLDALGRRAARRVGPRLDVDQAVTALNGFLFGEEGFRGNTEDYYDPRNSYLNEVLERRLGIPLTLCLVYAEVAGRCGLSARGIGFPGHFLVEVECGEARRLVDAFGGGRTLDEAGCRRLLEQVRGPRARFDPRYLSPLGPRQILVRMLANLKGIHVARADWPRALAAADRLLLLAPEALAELRDRGGFHARLGHAAAAIRDWEAYLAQAPEAADAGQVRQRVAMVRQTLAALN
jgi:regulator of sirC expression with transglutaminase-like and TPR domain